MVTFQKPLSDHTERVAYLSHSEEFLGILKNYTTIGGHISTTFKARSSAYIVTEYTTEMTKPKIGTPHRLAVKLKNHIGIGEHQGKNLHNYIKLAKYPSVGRVQCYGFTLSLIFKYCGGIGLY